MAAAEQRILERIRRDCRALPGATERLSHGDRRTALWRAAPVGLQATRVRSDPERFFVPPYVGSRGWLGVRLDRDLAWEEIAGVIEEAYAAIAPARPVVEAGL